VKTDRSTTRQLPEISEYEKQSKAILSEKTQRLTIEPVPAYFFPSSEMLQMQPRTYWHGPIVSPWLKWPAKAWIGITKVFCAVTDRWQIVNFPHLPALPALQMASISALYGDWAWT